MSGGCPRIFLYPPPWQAKLVPAMTAMRFNNEAYFLYVERRGMKPNAADGTFLGSLHRFTAKES
jgi:hypothetical protein